MARARALAVEVWGGEGEAEAFLLRPHPLLGGHLPLDVALGSEAGARLVEGILGRPLHGTAA